MDELGNEVNPEPENIDLSIRAALDDPSGDAVAARIGIECTLLLREERWYGGRWREFEPLVREAIEVCDALGNDEAWADLMAYRAGLNEARGRWEQCVRLAEQTLQRTNDPTKRAEALLHSASALHNLGQDGRALRELQRALSSAANDGAQSMRLKHKLHRVQAALGRRRSADALLDEVLAWARRTGSGTSFEAELLLDRAGRLRTSRPSEAMRLVARARYTYKRLGLVRGIAYANLEAGRIYSGLGMMERAGLYFERARTSFEAQAYAPGLAHALLGLGEVAMAKGALPQAIGLFKESVRHARGVGYRVAALRASAKAFIAAVRARDVTHAVSALKGIEVADARLVAGNLLMRLSRR